MLLHLQQGSPGQCSEIEKVPEAPLRVYPNETLVELFETPLENKDKKDY